MKIVLTSILLFFAFSAGAKVKTEKIEYKQGDTALEGFLAYDDAVKTPRPGVVLVHAWMGLDENVQRRAQDLAKLGYVAFAADIYGKGVRPKNQQEAGATAGKYKSDRPLLRARVNAGYQWLASQKSVDPAKIFSIGYCFGGTTVLELARSGTPALGVVSFHGGLDSPSPQDGQKIKAKVLILHGALDPMSKPADIAAFQKELNDAHVDYQFVSYANAVHSFTDPSAGDDLSKGAAYNALADHRSWEQMKMFFNEQLAKK